MTALPAEFLAQVVAHPDDDGPRLVAADWLDERGDPRGEFIRVQVELARMPAYEYICLDLDWSDAGHSDDCRRAVALRKRSQDLLDDHWARWTHDTFDDLAPDVGVSTGGDDLHVTLYGRPGRRDEIGDFRCEFRRGFVEQATVTTADFLRHADALRAAAPLRRVRLTTWPECEQTRTAGATRKVCLVGRKRWRRRDALGVNGVSGEHEAVVRRLLAAEFPGIEFELPDAPVYPTVVDWATIPAALAAVREQMVREAERRGTHDDTADCLFYVLGLTGGVEPADRPSNVVENEYLERGQVLQVGGRLVMHPDTAALFRRAERERRLRRQGIADRLGPGGRTG